MNNAEIKLAFKMLGRGKDSVQKLGQNRQNYAKTNCPYTFSVKNKAGWPVGC